MKTKSRSKVTPVHIERNAYLYVRQAMLPQVIEESDSIKRQYQLRERAVALGWPDERIITMDSDLGQSGAHAADRTGFQKLVAEIGKERAGLVLSLDVSRLTRNLSDWQRLLELCAHTCTLVFVEDGIYDPTDFNDRLLLGLNGTMRESELHMPLLR